MKNIFAFLFTIISVSSFSQSYISPFDFPLLLSGTFGELRSNHFHTGIDVKTESVEGKSIYAIEDGYISRIKVSTWGYGRVIYIVHPTTGHTSVYAHMQAFNPEIEKIIQKKQYKKESFEVNYYPTKNSLLVKQGDIIGLSGNSGQSGGPHLHFEIRDSKTEHPLNPLEFGFDVKDDINPILTEIKIYPHKNSSVNNKNNELRIPLTKVDSEYKLTSNSDIVVNGDISFAISTFDRQNGAPYNKNGVYSIKMYVDGKLIHHFEVDELSFSEKRFINSHIDYKEYKDNNIRFNRCYSLPYNKLSNYKTNINKGILHFSDTLLHEIKFEVSDIENNTSVIKFNVKSEAGSTKIKKSEQSEQFIYSEANIFQKDNFEAHIAEYSLYENCNISYSRTAKTNSTLSDIHNFMNTNIPLHKSIVISLKSDIPSSLRDKVYIAKLRENGTFSYKGKTWRDGFLSSKTREFGSYAIIADTTNPSIYAFAISTEKNKFGTHKSISIKIKDNESGIDFYRGELDEKWILMEYEHKKDLLTYYPSELSKGVHTLKMIVKDKLGNETVFTKEFTF